MTDRTQKGTTTRERKADRLPLYETRSYRRLQKRLAENIKALRQAREWTQEDAAHECGLTVRVWQRVERQEANVSLVTLARLVDGLGVDAATLFAAAARK